jgi:proline dehydrogenase
MVVDVVLLRTPSQLALSLEDARKHNYALGIKLVRGAYHPHEIVAHRSKGSSNSISPDELPPVWFKKEETDKCYNECVRTLLRVVREDIEEGTSSSPRQVAGDSWKSWTSWLPGYSSAPVQNLTQHRNLPSIGILFGTHNWESAKLILDELVRNDLAEALPEQYEGERVVQVKPEAVERVAIGQLKGMSDDLTQYLVRRTKAPTPFVIKYVLMNL